MFNSIAITRQHNGPDADPIDLGFLAEAMLFYGAVRVVGDQQVLGQLIRAFGPELLIDFIDAGYVGITYLTNRSAVLTQGGGTPLERHDFCFVSSPNHTLQLAVPRVVGGLVDRRGRARRVGQRLIDRIDQLELRPDLLEAGRADATDHEYTREQVSEVLLAHAPEYRVPPSFKFDVHRDSRGFVVETNLNLAEANRSYHLRVPPSHSSLSVAHFLDHMLTVYGTAFIAGTYATEIATDLVNSKLLSAKFRRLSLNRERSSQEIDGFQSMTLGGGRSVREAINSGARTLADLQPVLARATRFKAWLQSQELGEELIRSYVQEVSSASWIEHLPPKSVRWAIFSAAGIALEQLVGGGYGTAASLALSAGDQFILDRLIVTVHAAAAASSWRWA